MMYANQTGVKRVSVMDYYSFIYIMIRLMYFFLTKTHQAQVSQMQFQPVGICPVLGLLLSYKRLPSAMHEFNRR
jgi:hypothetical protein